MYTNAAHETAATAPRIIATMMVAEREALKGSFGRALSNCKWRKEKGQTEVGHTGLFPCSRGFAVAFKGGKVVRFGIESEGQAWSIDDRGEKVWVLECSRLGI